MDDNGIKGLNKENDDFLVMNPSYSDRLKKLRLKLHSLQELMQSNVASEVKQCRQKLHQANQLVGELNDNLTKIQSS